MSNEAERKTVDIDPITLVVEMTFNRMRVETTAKGNNSFTGGKAEIIEVSGIDAEKVNAFFGNSGNGSFMAYTTDASAVKPPKGSKAKSVKTKAKATATEASASPDIAAIVAAVLAAQAKS